ncbi:MAG: divalent-cation tolerance protein CutA [Acidobacteria bacterium]|nr:MAG: divalent-cation tolerance protein CutA [Acidobacteriota bacterium]
MEQPDALLVLTTWPANADPTAFATTLVEERLAACVNLLPAMDSIYRWQGRVERERERQIIIKTTRGRLEALKLRIHALHPYEVPELLAVPIADGGEAYLAWLAEQG